MDKSGYGAIIRNDKGEVMVAITASGLKVNTSDEAELLACEELLNLLWMLGSQGW